MAEMSNYLKQAVTDQFFRPAVAAPTRPTSHKISLWSAVTDSDAGTGTELTAGSAPGYVRTTVTWGNVTIPGGVLQTNLTIVFATATSNWPAATHYGIHDHVGNLLQSLTALTTPQTVLSGNHAEVAAGSFTLTLS